jgi:ABC-type Fe3+-hydroxamate transport system substrate-binding protein
VPASRSARRAALSSAAAVTAVAMAAPLLAGCSLLKKPEPAGAATRSVTDAEGHEVRVPAHPERVVVLGGSVLDAAIALGAEPLATSSVDAGGRHLPAYLADRAAPVRIVATPAGANLRKVAGLEPDLILLDETTGATRQLRELAAIAPAVVTARPGQGWKTALATTGRALGLRNNAGKLIADFDTDAAAARKEFGDEAGTAIGSFRWRAGALSPAPRGARNDFGSTLTALGLHRPGEGKGDWLFLASPGTPADGRKTYARARRTPGFTGLEAEKRGHVVVVDDSAWNGAGGPLAARIMFQDISRALEGSHSGNG